MRAVLGALLASTIAVAVAGASIRAGDRDVLIAPPQMVAENFVRSVVTKRYEPARKHLADAAAMSVGVGELHMFQRELQARAGQSSGVEGEAGSRDSDHATAAAIVHGKSAAVKIRLALRFEDAEWKIDSWSLPPGP